MEAAAQFNPTKLDTDQWVRSMLDFGAKQVVLTAKHNCEGTDSRWLLPAAPACLLLLLLLLLLLVLLLLLLPAAPAAAAHAAARGPLLAPYRRIFALA